MSKRKNHSKDKSYQLSKEEENKLNDFKDYLEREQLKEASVDTYIRHFKQFGDYKR